VNCQPQTRITIRVNAKELAYIRAIAECNRMSLAEWIRQRCYVDPNPESTRMLQEQSILPQAIENKKHWEK